MSASAAEVKSNSNAWRYCVVCRRHHEQGRKHIFTTKHKTKLNVIITKFAEKVKCARQRVQKPGLVEGELEPDATLWCYFCELEVMRHVTDRLTTIVWGGLLEHMASIPHHQKTRHFWWAHGADKKQLQNFLLFDAEYRRYKELVAAALQKLENKRELTLKEEVRAKEESQQHTAREPLVPQTPPIVHYTTGRNKYGVVQNPTGWHESRRVWGGGIVKYKVGSDQRLPWPIDSLQRSSDTSHDLHPSSSGGERRGKVTVGATADQLTVIQPPSLREGEGNVHSGATPPWLKEDEGNVAVYGEVAPVIIGPSEEEFLRHKEQSSGWKRENPNRVGADFHLRLTTQQVSSSDDKEWYTYCNDCSTHIRFPSFGRVWNSGPRSHSLSEFHRGRPSIDNSTTLTHSALATPFSTVTTSWDVPGPSGLHTHDTEYGGASSSSAGVVPGGAGSTTTWQVASASSISVPLEDIRPYIRKRKRRMSDADGK